MKTEALTSLAHRRMMNRGLQKISSKMIEKSEQQDIDRQGKRLIRKALEPLGWVMTEISEDYGVDYDVQVFVNSSPNGLWFKIQLKRAGGPGFLISLGTINTRGAPSFAFSAKGGHSDRGSGGVDFPAASPRFEQSPKSRSPESHSKAFLLNLFAKNLWVWPRVQSN